MTTKIHQSRDYKKKTFLTTYLKKLNLFSTYLIATLLPSITICLSGARSGGGSGSAGGAGDNALGGCLAANLISSANNSLQGGSGPNRWIAVLANRSE